MTASSLSFWWKLWIWACSLFIDHFQCPMQHPLPLSHMSILPDWPKWKQYWRSSTDIQALARMNKWCFLSRYEYTHTLRFIKCDISTKYKDYNICYTKSHGRFPTANFSISKPSFLRRCPQLANVTIAGRVGLDLLFLLWLMWNQSFLICCSGNVFGVYGGLCSSGLLATDGCILPITDPKLRQ